MSASDDPDRMRAMRVQHSQHEKHECYDEMCLRNLLGAGDGIAYFKDRQSRFVRVGRGQLARFGVREEADVVGKTDFDFFTEEHARPAYEAEQDIIETGIPVVDLLERETWDNRPPTWVLTNKMPLRDAQGNIVGTFGVSEDVTEQHHLRQQLDTVLANSPDGITRLDTDLRYVFANPAAESMMGQHASQIIGLSDREIGRDSELAEMWMLALRRVLETGRGTQFVHQTGHGAATRYYDSHIVAEFDGAAVVGILVMTRDVSDRKRAELALAERAVRDPLTNLANRVLLLDRIGQSLVRLDRDPGMLAVFFLDLDRFKVINDSLGHGFGDALLVEVSTRLTSCARRSDTVARLGGDEFVMLCDPVSGRQDAQLLAERLAQALAAPFLYQGKEIHITASIGVRITTDPQALPQDLIRDADTAMYQAKERGHGTGLIQLFEADVRERAVSRLTTEIELREGIKRRELRLFYQPVHAIASGRLQGFEALVRWEHPTRGLLQPGSFIPVAEETNLIVALGAWVLDEACRQLGTWNADRPPSDQLTMAVNVSARQLASRYLVDSVADCLKTHDLRPDTLCLEITETALLEEATTSPEIFAALHALGVRIALDDFGTGYSSLAHLRRFPVDVLKIDRQFVSGLDRSTEGTAIVAAINAMAHALGMTTVGEGIETASQLDQLRELGCDGGQGYLLGRPMPVELADALLGRVGAVAAGAK